MNVGKGGPNVDIALQQAWDAEVHICMVKKSRTLQEDGEFTTKSIPDFDSFIPFENTSPKPRPRAVTFVRKGHRAAQISPSSSIQSSDYCFAQICGLTFVNIYRAPGHSGNSYPLRNWHLSGSSALRGDLNSFSQD